MIHAAKIAVGLSFSVALEEKLLNNIKILKVSQYLFEHLSIIFIIESCGKAQADFREELIESRKYRIG